MGVTVVETLLFLVLIPAGVYGVITLLAMWPKLVRTSAHSGEGEWNFPPVLWVANPSEAGASSTGESPSNGVAYETQPNTARGGARGNW